MEMKRCAGQPAAEAAPAGIMWEDPTSHRQASGLGPWRWCLAAAAGGSHWGW